MKKVVASTLIVGAIFSAMIGLSYQAEIIPITPDSENRVVQNDPPLPWTIIVIG